MELLGGLANMEVGKEIVQQGMEKLNSVILFLPTNAVSLSEKVHINQIMMIKKQRKNLSPRN